MPLKETYPELDITRIALPRIESEIWRGFVFVRLEGGGPGVAAMMAPYDRRLRPTVSRTCRRSAA